MNTKTRIEELYLLRIELITKMKTVQQDLRQVQLEILSLREDKNLESLKPGAELIKLMTELQK